MNDEKEIIPRNVINKQDTLPVDFIIKFELELRQIPYFIVGGGITTFAIMNPSLQISYKIIVYIRKTTIKKNTQHETQTISGTLFTFCFMPNFVESTKQHVF